MAERLTCYRRVVGDFDRHGNEALIDEVSSRLRGRVDFSDDVGVRSPAAPRTYRCRDGAGVRRRALTGGGGGVTRWCSAFWLSHVPPAASRPSGSWWPPASGLGPGCRRGRQSQGCHVRERYGRRPRAAHRRPSTSKTTMEPRLGPGLPPESSALRRSRIRAGTGFGSTGCLPHSRSSRDQGLLRTPSG
jgi:hypothetical protein